MKKIIYLFITLLFFAGCNTDKKKTIAVATYVDHVVLNKIKDSFIEELNELGYTQEKGWQIIIRSANGRSDEANLVADELLNLKPKVIVSISTPSTKSVFDKNQAQVPHVYSFVSFPEKIGITKNAKNTTGLSDGVDFELNFKLIKEILPEIKKLGMVYSDEPNALVSKDEMLKLCKENGIELIAQAISKEDEIKQACQNIVNSKVDAIFIGADGVVVNQINAMIDVANSSKTPIFTTDEASVEAGAFAALSVNYDKFGQETAKLVDRVIKNHSANDIEPTMYYGTEIVINLNTASKINIQVPETVTKKAYKIIN